MNDNNGAFAAEFAKGKQWKLDPGLWAALLETLPAPPCEVVDLGAGMGRYVVELCKAGYQAVGIDGIAGIEKMSGGYVKHANLAQPLYFVHPGQWGLSFEVGEHIDAEQAGHYLDNLASSAFQGLMVSWAVPGQRGRNHINCQRPEYVIEQLTHRGWVLDSQHTGRAREVAGKGWDKKLLVFKPLVLTENVENVVRDKHETIMAAAGYRPPACHH